MKEIFTTRTRSHETDEENHFIQKKFTSLEKNTLRISLLLFIFVSWGLGGDVFS